MKNEKQQEEAILQGGHKKKKCRHRQSESNSERQSTTKTVSSSASTYDDEERLFQVRSNLMERIDDQFDFRLKKAIRLHDQHLLVNNPYNIWSPRQRISPRIANQNLHN